MPDQSPSAADRLRELKGLHDDGVISDDEFAEMRTSLLSEMGLPAAGAAEEPASDHSPEVASESEPPSDDIGSPEADDYPDIPERFLNSDASESLSDSPITGRQFLLIAVVVAIVAAVVLGAMNFRTIEHWAFPERLAYDTGVEAFQEWDDEDSKGYLSCNWLYLARITQVTESLDSGDVVGQVNDSLLGEAGRERTRGGHDWEPRHDAFFVSGYWDEAARTCPDAFDRPIIAGRP